MTTVVHVPQMIQKTTEGRQEARKAQSPKMIRIALSSALPSKLDHLPVAGANDDKWFLPADGLSQYERSK